MPNFENHSNYNCKITLENGDEFKIYANWMHNEKLDAWLGWACDAGKTRFYIDKNFDIWSGECKNDFLGNVLSEWDIINNNHCKQETCTGCTDDLVIRKYHKKR